MKGFGRLAIALILGMGAIVGLRWHSQTAPLPETAGEIPEAPTARRAEHDPASTAAPPPLEFGGDYGIPVADVSRGEALAHYTLGAELLDYGDYYSAASHLALARDGLGNFGRICEMLAITYDRLNMLLDLFAIMECLEGEAREHASARRLFDHFARHLDVEMEFEAAASDHFVVSFPRAGPSSSAIGDVLSILEWARSEVADSIGIASLRIVPVVVYEGDQFQAATDKPHWALGIYDGKIRVAIETYDARPEAFEIALAHEYVHALTHEYTGTRLPAWFREGLADTLAWQGVRGRGFDPPRFRTPGPLLDYDDLRGDFTGLPADLASRAYRQSHALVHNLVREADWGPIEDLLLELNVDDALQFDTAFAVIYGETPAAYFDRWLTFTQP